MKLRTGRARDHIERRQEVGPGNAGRWLASARFAIFFTTIACSLYLADQVRRLGVAGYSLGNVAETALAVVIVASLSGSAIAYLTARVGQLRRARSHLETPMAEIDAFFRSSTPSLTVLIPSYREETEVIAGTALSAALQEYPGLDVVLLIDDPPNPSTEAERALLAAARRIPDDINEFLAGPAAEVERRTANLLAAGDRLSTTMTDEQIHIAADTFSWCARWFSDQTQRLLVSGKVRDETDHASEFIARSVFSERSIAAHESARALRSAASDGASIALADGEAVLRRLGWIFDARVRSFERKTYGSLSHASSKAMNLNSYLGLMGQSLMIDRKGSKRVLVEAKPGLVPDLVVPDSDYALTLDADSILLPGYVTRLLYLLEQPEHRRTAIIQTPYSSFPNSPSRIERMAGATTDIQYLVHQGSTAYGASFWVGANALIRREALHDIRSESIEDGKRLTRYISDRTVIEDTESSVELRARGWQIHNYPARLSYSATPADFGSLAIQRKRWANGGLLVLPALARYWRRPKDGVERPSLAEVALRASYLGSLSASALALALVLVYPFDQQLLSWFAVCVAIPYFAAMSTDLRRCGYARSDIFGLYVFNLVLLAVNLAGTASSLIQGVGGHTVSFARTPKVKDRTLTQPMFIVVPSILLVWTIYSFAREVDAGNILRAGFVGLNAGALAYGMFRFIGIRNAFVDLIIGTKAFVTVPIVKTAEPDAQRHWATVLGIEIQTGEVAR